MATKTSTASSFQDAIAQATDTARGNDFIQQILNDKKTQRKLALAAAKVGGSMIGRRRAATKAAAATQAADEAPAIDAEAGEATGGKRKRRRGGLAKWLVLALAIGIAAAIANKGTREQILDRLFGAEEEFNYESTTTASVNGSH